MTPDTERRGIETEYQGALFRSRLEARWAAMFDRIGWSWVYEPFDGNGYIPDFVIEGPAPMLIEVRPATTLAQYVEQVGGVEEGVAGIWDGDILILGTSPHPKLDKAFFDFVTAGYLGEHHEGAWTWDLGLWNVCKGAACTCTVAQDPADLVADILGGKVAPSPERLHGRHLSVIHQSAGWHHRPCGLYCGDHLINTDLRPDTLVRSWNKAGRTVRWTK